jgi:hypothetical protein
MPTPDAPTPHDLTLENIRCVADYSDDACGCEHRGDRWFMCAYHEGYDDGVERMVWIMERVHGPPMPDPSPDTPNVCPTAEVLVRAQFVDGEVWLVDDEGNEVGVMARSTFDRCVARPAAGSSSPDVAALVERLRDDGLRARHHDEVLTADDACRWGGVGALLWAEDMVEAADALEAQAETPNVCPTCDDTGLVAPLGGRGSDGPDPCPHCTPAAGSSSPDTAALVAELRGPSGLASTSRAKHLTVGVCAVAADALEAQAARITELEAAMADHTLTTPTEETE